MEILQIYVCGLIIGISWWNPAQFRHGKKYKWFLRFSKDFKGYTFGIFGFQFYAALTNPMVP